MEEVEELSAGGVGGGGQQCDYIVHCDGNEETPVDLQVTWSGPDRHSRMLQNNNRLSRSDLMRLSWLQGDS